MKAQNYQIRSDNNLIISFVIALAMAIFPVFAMGEEHISELSAGIYIYSFLSMVPMIFVVFSLVLVTKIIGWDMGDKTLNYDILSGHSRAEVYFSRIIVALAWGIGASVVCTALPIVIVTLMNGWGAELLFNEFIVRYLLIVFTGARIVTMVILVTTIVSNYIASAFVSYFIIAVETIAVTLLDVVDIKSDHLVAFYDIENLSYIENSKTIVIDGVEVTRFIAEVPVNYMMGNIVSNIVAISLMLFIGFVIFKKRDLK